MKDPAIKGISNRLCRQMGLLESGTKIRASSEISDEYFYFYFILVKKLCYFDVKIPTIMVCKQRLALCMIANNTANNDNTFYVIYL